MHVAQRALVIAQQLGANNTEVNRFARKYYIIAEGRELPEEWKPKPEMYPIMDNEEYNSLFFKQEEETNSMFRNLAYNKEIRLVLDILFLHGYNDHECAETLYLSGYHGITEKVISMYRYFFFDPSLIDSPEEFEKILEYMPRVLSPHEHRAAYYNPWIGQLYTLNILVPVNFEKLTEAATSVAYARLMRDFYEKRNEISFGELMRAITKSIELRAKLNVDKDNEALKIVLERIGVNFAAIKNKSVSELMAQEEAIKNAEGGE